MSLEVNSDRRRFLRTSAMALVASDLAMISPAKAEVNKMTAETGSPIKRGTHTSFASLKQVKAGALSVGYAEAGPVDGPVVILLDGWPYDIYAYVDVAPRWHQRATGSSFHTCAASDRLVSFRLKRFATASNWRLPSIRSPLWMRSRSIEQF